MPIMMALGEVQWAFFYEIDVVIEEEAETSGIRDNELGE